MSSARASVALRSSARAAAALEARQAGAPASVLSIPTKGLDFGDANVGIRQIGATRRVFLRQPHLTPEEIEGLGYRIKLLSNNEAINSVLIAANDGKDNPLLLPQFVRESERSVFSDAEFSNDSDWHVAGGYDPLQVFKSGMYQDSNAVKRLLNNVQQLALAVRGDAKATKIPVITLPHGLINDGGYALCMGSYVMATNNSSFRVTHPSRGLAFDPIGLSYILPRLGWEFNQPSSNYPGVGTILALTGMEANASDMMETGLATHYVDSPKTLALLEEILAEIEPWKAQKLLPENKRMMGEPVSTQDKNAAFRNKMVANTLHALSVYHVSGRDMWTNRAGEFHSHEQENDDPSLVLDPTPWDDVRESDIVNYAATFEDIFAQESSVAGILESFREISSRVTADSEEQEGIQVAADFVNRMEKQSPLSLSVVHRMMELGKENGETLESCMEREKRVQAKLFRMADFQNWAKNATQNGKDSPFTGWKHETVSDVSTDEVEELLQE